MAPPKVDETAFISVDSLLTPDDDDTTRTPNVSWAQRRDRVYLTIELADCTHPKIKVLDDGRVDFTAEAGSEGDRHRYAIHLELYDKVNAKDSKISIGARHAIVVVMKPAAGPHWPRLLKAPGKPAFLKTDFAKWKDEDEETEASDIHHLRIFNTCIFEASILFERKPTKKRLISADWKIHPSLANLKISSRHPFIAQKVVPTVYQRSSLKVRCSG